MAIRVKRTTQPFSSSKTRQPLSRRWLWGWAIILIALGIWAAFFDFPSAYNRLARSSALPIPTWEARPFRLGLDLLGGSELVYEADLAGIPAAERSAALEGVRDVVERRVNALGVSEPVVQSVRTGGTYRVIAQLAGVRDVNEAIQEIGETPILEFKEQPVVGAAGDTANPEVVAALQKISDIEGRVRADRTITLDALAEAFDLEVTELGFMSKWGAYPELWNWADTHRVGERNTEAITGSDGWHFITVTDARKGSPEIEARHILVCYQGARACERDTSKEDARKQIEDLKARATPQNFVELAKQHSTEPGAAESGGALGWFGPGRMVRPFEEAVFAERVGTISDVVETEFGFHLIYKINERALKEYAIRDLAVLNPAVAAPGGWANTSLSGKHLVRAQTEFDQTAGTPLVALKFNDEGKALFGEITARNVGKQVAIFLDGGIISAPVVQQEIRGGEAVIQGTFNIQEAKQLAQRLNAGALPVPIKLLSQQTVGATLGQESLQKSLLAGLIGFALVALFMILYYRIPGLLSVIALGLYVAFVLALFKLIPVTLTLAGLAGFIMTMGMAVDANVLIFERLKEELKAGRSLANAIDEGFKRAWTSIRDGNLTTIIAALILFWFSSSVIKGFALTLFIGVLLSMFSAIAVTRIFLQLVATWRWKRHLGWFATGIKSDPHRNSPTT